ncbi:plasmid stabilization protein [Agromyces sp. H66]|uniref:FitA-like ribbon-helix-helix domain-containing protein n=1 Tax=Agromyces sp. H66 TaxID=2529859 RepID=UPI0010AAD12E|nr:plasmid stabilization protein [Agromyces sp. H66]
MGTITVRNLDDAVQQRLRERAAAHGRSMEAEVREILTSAVGRVDFVRDWLEIAVEYRGLELPEPSRSLPRRVDL